MLAPDRTGEVAALLQEGITLAKAGDKEAARQKIQRVTELEPNNEAAWLWLASLYSELNVAAYCLQRALAINPTNEKAAQALGNVQQRMLAAQNAALAAEAHTQQAPPWGPPQLQQQQGQVQQAQQGQQTAQQARAGVMNSGPMNSGPMNSGPMSSGAMASGPMASGPMHAGVMMSGPMASGPMRGGQMASGPMASGPMHAGMMNSGPMNSGPMESFDFEELKRRGIVAAKGGRRDEAKAYLLAATEANDTDAETWLWLATVVEDPEDKQIALENVLTLDPLNEAAQAEMKENSVRLAQARAAGSANQMQWDSQTNLPPAFPLQTGPLAGGMASGQQKQPSGPLKQAVPATVALSGPLATSGPLSGPSAQSSLFASPTSAVTSGKLGKGTTPQVGDFIAFRYKVMSVTPGPVGMDYTAHEVGTRNFYTLRAQKVDASDLKKTKVNYVVDHGIPYTLVPLGTKGFTVRNFVGTAGAMPVEAAVAYTQTMLSRLQAIHAKGPVLSARKQLTPDTVTFGSDGEIALEGEDQKIMAPEDGVSRKFLPPELLTSGSPAPTSDIYAVGAILFFMITGSPPPAASDIPRKQGEEIWPPHFAGHQEIPEPIARVLAIAMQPNPSERYSSAQEMNAALAATSYGKKVKKAKGTGSSPLPLVLVAVVALAAVGLGFLAGTGKMNVPFVPNPNDQPIVLVLPTPTVDLPTATPVPVVPLARLTAHTVDTRRFPTNSVFFSAVDANGGLVQGLTTDNVKITDNGADGKNLQLTPLRQTTDPVSIIFALDNSLLMKGRPMDDAKTAIHLFVEQMTPGDQMALMTFGGEGNYVVDYTVSKNQFLSAVDGVQPVGKPDLFPAVMFAAQRTTFQPQGGYTALIVISDSPLNASKAVVQATSHAANLANLPIFYLGLDKANYSADVVQQIASDTGGLAVVAEKPDAGGAWDAMRKIDAELHDVYKLTYDSTTLDTKAAHNIQLSVTANGATQTDKRSYEVLNK